MWPAADWEVAGPPPGVDLAALLDRAFDPDGPMRETFAVVMVQAGRVVAERYGAATDATTTLVSWSMAKSFLHAAVGILVKDGVVQIQDRPEVPEWSDEADPRREITLDHLLTMRDGLDFVEDYVDDRASHVIPMLFGEGKQDVAHYAADRDLAHPPGQHFNYSSGTTNIISRFAGGLMGGDAASRERWLRQRLLEPIGMGDVSLTFDAAGTWIASSFLYATARHFARFGYLYLRDGVWDGERLLPEGWVAHGTTPRPGSVEASNGNLYGAQWWVLGDEHGSYWANGYEGQSVFVVPPLDLVVVRLGKTPADRSHHLKQWRSDVAAAFSPLG